jgi:serine protease Do
MVRAGLPFRNNQRNLAAVTIATILMVASTAHAEIQGPRDQVPSATPPAALVQRVADGGPGAFADLAERVEPAVISVVAKASVAGGMVPGQMPRFGSPDQGTTEEEETAPGAPDQGKAPGQPQGVTIGSGFFISADGYAVTNSHVVEDADAAEIRTSDDKIYPARVVGKDPLSDLALIKVDGRSDFAFVKLAEQPPRVGDWVLAVGNTFGLGATVTAGIVSARDREIGQGNFPNRFIQIDAPINRGDSGGPTFDTRGDVIGVNSMIFSPSGGSVGVAFAVPAETVRTVIPQLKDKGTVTRGWIGAEVQSVTPDLADGLGATDLRGAIVTGVKDDGPAAKAGLRRGDVITSIGGSPVRDANELIRKVQSTAPGSSIQIAMVRQRQQGSLSVTPDELPRQTGSVRPSQPGRSKPKSFEPGPR